MAKKVLDIHRYNQNYLTGTDKDVASAIALLVHETVHVNKMSDKDERKEAKATGKDTGEEKLADQIEDRTKDKVKTSDDTLTDEEFDNLQEELNASNKEKGREQKSLAQGTEAAKEVSEENKENNAIPIGAPTDPISLGLYFTLNKTDEQKKADEQLAKEIVEWFENGVTFYVDGAKKIWEFVLDDVTKGTFDKKVFDKLLEDQKALFYEANPTLKNLINESSWGLVDKEEYTYNPLRDGEYIPIGEEANPEDIIPPQEYLKPEVQQEEFPLEDNSGVVIVTAESNDNSALNNEKLQLEYDSNAGENNISLYIHIDPKTGKAIDDTKTGDKSGKYLNNKIDEKIKSGEYPTNVVTEKVSEYNKEDTELIKSERDKLEGKNTVLGIPYENSRPSYGKNQVDEAWEAAKDLDGRVFDSNTGKELFWDKSKSRAGQWDMGHKKDQKYSDVFEEYKSGNLTKEEFLDWYKTSDNYIPEDPKANRSHEYE